MRYALDPNPKMCHAIDAYADPEMCHASYPKMWYATKLTVPNLLVYATVSYK